MNKLKDLENYLINLESIAIAFSGGVDSTFLLKIASNVLKEKVIAITILSCFYPKREKEEAKNFCLENNIKQIFIEINPLEIDSLKQNPTNRCYICKKFLFTKIKEIALQNNIKYVCDGTNFGDIKDYRPGLKALEELKILSPLKEVQLTKQEIRDFSKDMNLKTWNKPSFACLATRFPVNNEISIEKLKMVEKAEDLLFNLKFKQFRVRIHNDIAKIEVLQNDFEKILQNKEIITKTFKEIGFKFITLDLNGYKTGNMN